MKHWDLGRLTTYVGGGGVFVSSVTKGAAAVTQCPPVMDALAQCPPVETVSLLQLAVPVPVLDVTVRDITTVGGFFVVIARFAWDVWRDNRTRRERNE